MSGKRGRPPSDNPRAERVQVPVTAGEHRALKAWARRQGADLAPLIRETALAAAKDPQDKET